MSVDAGAQSGAGAGEGLEATMASGPLLEPAYAASGLPIEDQARNASRPKAIWPLAARFVGERLVDVTRGLLPPCISWRVVRIGEG
jgi:hypothetical protein